MPQANEYLERFFRGVLSSRCFLEFVATGGDNNTITDTKLADSGLSADFWRRAKVVRVDKSPDDVDFERTVTVTTPAGFSVDQGGAVYADTTPGGERVWLVRLPAGWGMGSMYELLNQALEQCFEWDALPVTMVLDGDMRLPSAVAWSQVGTPATFAKDETVTFRNRRSLHLVSDGANEFAESGEIAGWPGEGFYFEATFENHGSVEPAVGVWNVDAAAWVPGFPLGAGLATQEKVVTAQRAFNVPANCYRLKVRVGSALSGVDLYTHETVLQSSVSRDVAAPEVLRSSRQARRLVRMGPGQRIVDGVVLAESREPCEVVHPEVDVMNSFGDAARLRLPHALGDYAWRIEFSRPYRIPAVDPVIDGTEPSACPLEYGVASMAELFYKAKAAPENGSDEMVNLGARDYWRGEYARRSLEFKPAQEVVAKDAYSNMGSWGPG